MIIEIPNENSIVKWKNDDKDEWKAVEISDLIKAYERPQGKWIDHSEDYGYAECPFCYELTTCEVLAHDNVYPKDCIGHETCYVPWYLAIVFHSSTSTFFIAKIARILFEQASFSQKYYHTHLAMIVTPHLTKNRGCAK